MSSAVTVMPVWQKSDNAKHAVSQSNDVCQADPHGTALWAGAGFRAAKAAPAAVIVRELAG
jgi:hypothetical protein